MPIDDMEVLDGGGGDVPCEFVTGQAGTGKTYGLKKLIEADPLAGKLCATTGIAAINLDTVTINSVLGYFDTSSLEDNFQRGVLEMKLARLAQSEGDNEDQRLKRLMIDEVSMMDGLQLDIIRHAVGLVNERRGWHEKEPFGITLTGDFCQLPPVKAKWAFEAECWPEFEANTTKLTKVWRQQDADFLAAINAIRSGDGRKGVELLQKCGVEFLSRVHQDFDGTTIIPKNDGVDRFNWLCHQKVQGKMHVIQNQRWGKLRPEWQRQIPEVLNVKEGAYVMILTNDSPLFHYANGDCGHIVGMDNGTMMIQLVRNGETVGVPLITRSNTQRHTPEQLLEQNPGMSERELRAKYALQDEEWEPSASRPIAYSPASDGETPFWVSRKRQWVLGQVDYIPLRLAYATTVHKSQGLTLDKLQVDVHHGFFGAPAMAYVALSRARNAQGLKVVGTPAMLAQRVNTDPKVQRWL